MEMRTFRDNEVLTGISILAVLQYTKELSIAKALLVEPILSYTTVIKALNRANSRIKSIEELIIKESIAFSNFNSRYYEKLILSVNAIILFNKLGLISISNNVLGFSGKDFDFNDTKLGDRANARIKAALRLSEILVKGDASDFYLSLRVEI